MMRLDKFLAHMGQGTRTEVKQSLKRNVTVNGKVENLLKLKSIHIMMLFKFMVIK